MEGVDFCIQKVLFMNKINVNAVGFHDHILDFVYHADTLVG